MNRSANIFAPGVIDGLLRETAARIAATDQTIRLPLVGANQTDAARYRLADEVQKRYGIDGINHASNDITFARDCADNGSLARADSAATAFAATALISVLVLEVAANEGFVDFNDAEQLQEF